MRRQRPSRSTVTPAAITTEDAIRLAENEHEIKTLTERISQVLAARHALAQHLLDTYGRKKSYEVGGKVYVVAERKNTLWISVIGTYAPPKQSAAPRMRHKVPNGLGGVTELVIDTPRPPAPAPKAIMITPTEKKRRDQPIHERTWNERRNRDFELGLMLDAAADEKMINSATDADADYSAAQSESSSPSPPAEGLEEPEKC